MELLNYFMDRREVEAKISGMGDYVKIEYLSSLLQKGLDYDTKRFVLVKLAKINDDKGMAAEAAKCMNAAAEINPSNSGRVNDFIEAAGLYIRAGRYEEADITFNKAVIASSESDGVKIKDKKKQCYMIQADSFLARDKRAQAVKTYERILRMDLSNTEKRFVQGNLLLLYEKLGRVRDYYVLKNSMH